MGIIDRVGKVAVGLGKAVGLRAGDENLASHKLGLGAPSLEVTSTDFTSGTTLPRAATCEGEGRPPAIAWSEVPPRTRSVVLVVEDPDAPVPEPFVHWLVYGIPSTTTSLDGASTGREGKNSKLEPGFTPAEPPHGHGLHHYHFRVFALDDEVVLEPAAGRSALFDAMKNHVLAWGDLVGTYERS